uniref:GLTSCR protein conserved domain-containing protein n=1 Tax=Strongyloides stercoralis TaxID=6248 RepID=A0A913HF51_STRER
MKEENRMSAIVADNIDKVDDSVFKTPFLPSKKGNCKKNENRNNGHLEEIPQEEHKINTKTEIKDNERNDLLLDPFYNHKCPHTDSFIKKTWPDLSGSTVGDCEDLVMEVIIDDFSILLFRNNEEYNEFMKAENNRQAKLDAERRQKEMEAEARRRKEKKKALKKKLKLEKKMKKKKFEMESGMQSTPLSSEEKAERKRLKREMKEKKREERRLLRNQNKIAGVETGNKKKCRGSSLSPVLLSSDVPSTSNCTNLDSKHMQSPRTNDGYSLLAPNNNMKRPSSTSVDSGIIGGPPTSKLPKLEVDELKSSMLGIAVKTAEVVNVNKIPATPPSANTANGHSGTPTSSMDIKNSLSNNNSIQNSVSVSTPQTPSSSKQGLLTPGMQPTQCFSNNMMFMEILKTNPGLAAMLPNNAGLQVNIQNSSLSSNQSQQLLHLQQIIHHQNTLANSVVQRGISNNNNPSNLIQQQMQMASSQIMPNMPIHNNLGTSLMNGFAGQINVPVVSTPSTRPVPLHGSQVVNKTPCNFSDTHLKICMEINNAKCTTPTINNGIPTTSNASNSTNTIQNNVSNISTPTNESKKTTSILQATNSIPGITTGIVPSSSNILSTPGKAVNSVIPTNTPNNLTHQHAAMIQAMNAQLQQVNNAKLVVGNQRPQSVMANGGLFFNTSSGTNVPNNTVNQQALFSNNMSNSNEAAFQQLMMQAALQANGNIGQIQQQNPLLAAQISAMQQQHSQATNLLIQNAVNAQNSVASNLLSVNTNQTPGTLNTNGDPNKSLLNSVNSKNVLIAQANEQKQKLLSICTNEILKCAQQIQHYQNLLNTLQIPAEKEAAKAEYMKYVAMHAELNNNLINIKSQLNTPLQQENLITAQQQLQAAAMAMNTNNRSQLTNNISIPNTMINNISVDSLYEIQRQAAAQQHILRQYQNFAGIQQFQQQNQLNAAASVQNASMLQNQYAQSHILQMQQLLAAQHPIFKQSSNSNSGNHNLEQLHRQRSSTITGEISNPSNNGVCHQ